MRILQTLVNIPNIVCFRYFFKWNFSG